MRFVVYVFGMSVYQGRVLRYQEGKQWDAVNGFNRCATEAEHTSVKRMCGRDSGTWKGEGERGCLMGGWEGGGDPGP